MRVIAGEARGHKLKAPDGLKTRPMTDRVKEALFSVLDSLGVAPDRVLDLYAGSGALGIEALSRWADQADFVEGRGDACGVIQQNLQHTKFDQQAVVYHQAVESFLGRRTDEPYDLVFVDPPYADPQIVATLARLGQSALVKSDTIIVLGHWPQLALPPAIDCLHFITQRCYGNSCFTIYEVWPHAGQQPKQISEQE